MTMINMKETKAIYFDMDGTVADLYGTKHWLDNLRNERKGTFKDLEPMVDMVLLQETCLELISQGWTIGVITWLPMNASTKYEVTCAGEKLEWIEKYMPYVSEFYAQSYGTPKQDAPRVKSDTMILVDDNREVRQMWEELEEATTIDATGEIITELRKLLDK